MDDKKLTTGLSPNEGNTIRKNYRLMTQAARALADNITIAYLQGCHKDILASVRQFQRIINLVPVCCTSSFRNVISCVKNCFFVKISGALQTIDNNLSQDVLFSISELLQDLQRKFVAYIYGEQFSIVSYLFNNLDNCDNDKYDEAIETLNFLVRKNGDFLKIKRYSAEEKKKIVSEHNQYIDSPFCTMQRSYPQMEKFRSLRFDVPYHHVRLCELFEEYSFCFR